MQTDKSSLKAVLVLKFLYFCLELFTSCVFISVLSCFVVFDNPVYNQITTVAKNVFCQGHWETLLDLQIPFLSAKDFYVFTLNCYCLCTMQSSTLLVIRLFPIIWIMGFICCALWKRLTVKTHSKDIFLLFLCLSLGV